MLDLKRVLAAIPANRDPEPLQPLPTPWTDAVTQRAAAGDAPWNEHPHPQWQREAVTCLNGYWDYAILPAADCGVTVAPSVCDADDLECASLPAGVAWERILVPFSPEAPLSGVGHELQPDELLWYRRDLPVVGVRDKRVLLHFDAVDWACVCWVGGQLVGSHEGGDLPFCFDITDAVMRESERGHSPEGDMASSSVELLLCVFDPTDAACHLRGKQKLRRGNIWYSAQSGIWQSVWLEVVPQVRLLGARISADSLGLLSVRAYSATAGGELRVQVMAPDGAVVGEGTAPMMPLDEVTPVPVLDAQSPAAVATLQIRVPGARPWTPADPTLYTLRLSYGDDVVGSYCAFRSMQVKPDAAGIPRVHLNGEPLLLKAVLDQGRWPDGLLTPPCDAALIHDIESMRELGFNTLRKHMKIELDRWYWHCDRLGMLVWQDMQAGGDAYSALRVSVMPTLSLSSVYCYRDDIAKHLKALGAADARYRDEWTRSCRDTVLYLGNHPSIALWTLFNEGWGQFDARKACAMVRELDPTRPIDATSGWYDQGCGDFFSVHNYFRPLEVWRDPNDGGRNGCRAFAISEFGGLTYAEPEHQVCSSAYGYDGYADANAWTAAVRERLEQAQALEASGLAAYVYTQLSDVEEEVNGLLTYDRAKLKLRD